MTLLDAGAKLNMISVRLLAQMGIEPTQTKKTINVAKDVDEGCKGIVKDVPVMVADLFAQLEFLAVKGVLHQYFW